MIQKLTATGIILLALLVGVSGCSGEKKSTLVRPASQQTLPAGNSGPVRPGAEIIVQSDNSVTDLDKQAALNELQGEVDALVDGLNQLDDAPESATSFD